MTKPVRHILTITNPIDHTISRTVVVTGYITSNHISKAIEALDDNTPLGLVPDNKSDYFVAIMPYEG